MGPQRMYGLTPWVRRLLVANLLVFLVQSTLFTNPDYSNAFAFSPQTAWEHPWTFVTYMFLHAGILHLVLNMLMLFFFGPSVEDRMGGRVFVLFYLLCGIGGGGASFLFSQMGAGGKITRPAGGGLRGGGGSSSFASPPPPPLFPPPPP